MPQHLAPLSAADAEAVAQIRAMEVHAGCRIDTARAPGARMQAEAARLSRLRDLPVPDDFGWGCPGYSGPPLTLRSGASDASPVIGQAMPGLFLYSEYLRRDGWTFIVARRGSGGMTVTEGWTRDAIRSSDCIEDAG